jgi:hypothetical protein
MATLEGTRASAEFCVRNVVPDVCKSPAVPVPYQIVSFFNCAVNFSTNVKFRKQPVFRHNSRLTTVIGNESGVGGGVASQVNKGWCRPIPGTLSTTIIVNGQQVGAHLKTYMFMNCAGPEGPPNTVGQVLFLGNMLPGPVAPSGKIPQGSFCGTPEITDQLKDMMGTDIDGLVEKGKMLYDLAKTDWSDPSAVLGAIGGVAGIAGLQDVAGLAQKGKELFDKGKKLYDTGKKLLNTDWSNPQQALAAIAGVANVANMGDIAKAATMASKIRDVIRTDWSDPRQAYAAAATIMKTSGMNQMFAQMASNAILSGNVPVNTRGNLPPIFPSPGGMPGASSGGSGSGKPGSNGAACHIPTSPSGTPRRHINQEVLDYFKEHNPVAHQRYEMLSDEQKCNAFVEIANPNNGELRDGDYSRAAMYIPGEGFSTSKAELDKLPNISSYLPDGFTSLFVASQDTRSVGRFFGIEQKDGNAYLLGGLIDLGSPGMPGAGDAKTWWIPDRILNADMSPYYDKHDRDYYGSDVRLGDLGKILGHELDSLRAGATLNPLQLPLQALYSAATTTVGVGTATFNSLSDAFSGIFGGGPGTAPAGGGGIPAMANSFLPGGCLPDLGLGTGAGGFPGMSTIPMDMPGIGGCFPGMGSVPGEGQVITTVPGAPPSAGAPPTPAEVSVPEGAASGAGTDGVVVTIWAGNPSAAADAILAEIKEANDKALADAREKERQEAEKAAKEKKEKAEKAQKAEKAEADQLKGEKEDHERQDGEKDDSEKQDSEKQKEEQAGGDDDSKEDGPPKGMPQDNESTKSSTDETLSEKVRDAVPGGAADAVEKGAKHQDSELAQQHDSDVEKANADAAELKNQADAAKESADATKQQLDSKMDEVKGADFESKDGYKDANIAAQEAEKLSVQHDAETAKATELKAEADRAQAHADELKTKSPEPSTAGKLADAAGKLLDAKTLLEGANDVNNALQEGDTRTAAVKGGETIGDIGGGMAGAAAGAKAGLLCGPKAPICVPVFAAIGGIVGSIGGEMAGGAVGGAIHDKIVSNAPPAPSTPIQAPIPTSSLPSSSYACFVAHTNIKLSSESIPIESIRPGMVVLSFCEATTSIVESRVSKVMESFSGLKLELILSDGSSIATTPNHRFKLSTGNWLKAKELKLRDSLFQAEANELSIVGITQVDCKLKVYNLEVEKYHNFFVERGVLVHNMTMDAGRPRK